MLQCLPQSSRNYFHRNYRSRKIFVSLLPLIAKIALACALMFQLSSMAHAETAEDLNAKLGKLGYVQGDVVERVENYRIDGWNYLDDEHIVIYAGPSKRFLITSMINCPDLSSAENIGFTSTVNFVTKFDKLIVRGPGGIVRNCPITEIRMLSKPAK